MTALQRAPNDGPAWLRAGRAMRTWIKDPLAIFADGAERGLVVEGTRIAELVGRGETPERIDATFDASRHVVLPGLVNTHHHFYQTLTRAHPVRDQQGAVRLADRALSDLGAAQAGPTAARRAARAGRAHAVGLHDRRRSSLPLSGGPRERGRHRGRGGALARHAHDRLARLDEPVAEGRRPAARQRRAGRGRRSSPTASGC